MGIKVRVHSKGAKFGYYEHKRRKQGDVFEIRSEKEFSGRWMEKVSADAPVEPAKVIKETEGRSEPLGPDAGGVGITPSVQPNVVPGATPDAGDPGEVVPTGDKQVI